MRGFLQPSVKRVPSEAQKTFGSFARGKRTKLAKLASTTLVKADQWARGDAVATEVAQALEKALAASKAKAKK
jgi:hypothetical protein